MFKVGDTIKLFGKITAVVTSVHSGGKRLGVTYDGKATFTSARNATAVAA
jgi:hypothetical protein